MYKQTSKREFGPGGERKGIKRPNLSASALTNSSYSGELNWYSEPPCEEISIEECESFALDRLQVLKALEAASIRNKTNEQMQEIFQRVSRDYMPLPKIFSTLDNEPILRKDFISHYILRLAFCRSEELRRWFVKYETLLFQLKFNMAQSSTKEKFIKMLGSAYEMVSDQEKQQLRSELNACKFGGFAGGFETETFLKIPFEKVAGLVGSRQVYLSKGFAFVPCEYSLTWIKGEFKNILEKGLLDLMKTLPQLDEDERLMPLLEAASKKSVTSYDITESQKVAGEIDANDVPKLEVHFPLCMRNLASALKKEQHLKHGGRLQFGLFLKGIGLPLEQALEYWRMAFIKVGSDDFKKKYAYGIRHNYGQEGNRKNYSPLGCEKIINSVPGASDQHHGCPFKNFNPERLTAEVRALNPIITNSEISELLTLVKAKHYNIACSRYFELTHPSTNVQAGPTSLAEPISHPNQYFELSYKFSKIALQNQSS